MAFSMEAFCSESVLSFIYRGDDVESDVDLLDGALYA